MTLMRLNRNLIGLSLILALSARAAEPDVLPGTQPLTVTGDIASQMIDGIDKFLLNEIEKSAKVRAGKKKRDVSSGGKIAMNADPNINRLIKMLGLYDVRVPFDAPELVATTEQPALVGKGSNYE